MKQCNVSCIKCLLSSSYRLCCKVFLLRGVLACLAAEKTWNIHIFSSSKTEKKSELLINVKFQQSKINKFLVKKTDGLIFSSYLPFLSEKILELYLKQVPQLWQEKEIIYDNFDKDLSVC